MAYRFNIYFQFTVKFPLILPCDAALLSAKLAREILDTSAIRWKLLPLRLKCFPQPRAHSECYGLDLYF